MGSSLLKEAASRISVHTHRVHTVTKKSDYRGIDSGETSEGALVAVLPPTHLSASVHNRSAATQGHNLPWLHKCYQTLSLKTLVFTENL